MTPHILIRETYLFQGQLNFWYKETCGFIDEKNLKS